MRRKLVRLHLVEPHPTLEGIMAGSPRSHYRLLKPSVLEGPDRTRELSGEVFVPRERVVFVQRIG